MWLLLMAAHATNPGWIRSLERANPTTSSQCNADLDRVWTPILSPLRKAEAGPPRCNSRRPGALSSRLSCVVPPRRKRGEAGPAASEPPHVARRFSLGFLP
jgi:hypothetical protein